MLVVDLEQPVGHRPTPQVSPNRSHGEAYVSAMRPPASSIASPMSEHVGMCSTCSLEDELYAVGCTPGSRLTAAVDSNKGSRNFDFSTTGVSKQDRVNRSCDFGSFGGGSFPDKERKHHSSLQVARVVLLKICNFIGFFRNIALFVLCFVAPLLIFIYLDGNDMRWRVLYVVLVVVTSWLCACVDISVVALYPVFLFPMVGAIPATEVVAAYMKSPSVLFLGSSLLAAAISRVELDRRIALFILLKSGVEVFKLMLGLMICSAFLSMWISNTATTSMLIPIVAIVGKLLDDQSPDDRSMPVSGVNKISECPTSGTEDKETTYFAKGTCAANLAVDSDAEVVNSVDCRITCEVFDKSDLPATDLHADTLRSGPAEVRMYPSTTQNDSRADETRDCTVSIWPASTEELAHRDSPPTTSSNQRIQCMLFLALAYSSSIGGIATLTGTATNTVLTGLMIDRFGSHHNVVTFGKWMFWATPLSVISLIIAWLLLQIVWLGPCQTLANLAAMLPACRLPSRFDWRKRIRSMRKRSSSQSTADDGMVCAEATIPGIQMLEGVDEGSSTMEKAPKSGIYPLYPLASTSAEEQCQHCQEVSSAMPVAENRQATVACQIQDRINRQYEALGPWSFGQFIVAGLLCVLIVLLCTRAPGFISGWGVIFPAGYVDDSTVAVLIGALPCILPLENVFCGIRPRTYQPILNWDFIVSKVDWGVILILGGGCALAAAIKRSHLDLSVASGLERLSSLPTPLLVFVILVIVSTLTELTSNIATANIVIPILLSLSYAIGVHPLFLCLPATVSSSFAFMLPIASPPNALVFKAANMKSWDMFKTGILLNFLCCCISLGGLYLWGIPIFELDRVPIWATEAAAGPPG